MYRDKLEKLCNAMAIDQPIYVTMEQGPDHEKLFRGKLIVNELTFFGDEYRRKKRDAESEVAGMAYRLLGGNQGHLLYKNLLQQLVVANGLQYPVYTHTQTGLDHMPVHMAKVEVDGKLFEGRPASTRRWAELSAAGVAYRALLPDMKFNHSL